MQPETPLADWIDPGTLANAETIADLVVAKLGGPVISSVIPAEVGAWIRQTCGHSQLLYRHMIPMNGPSCIHSEWRLNPDGSIIQELQDTTGCAFWRGTFRPAEAVPGA